MKEGWVKRSILLTEGHYSKVDRLARAMSLTKSGVLAVAIDNLYRTRFQRKRRLQPVTP